MMKKPIGIVGLTAVLLLAGCGSTTTEPQAGSEAMVTFKVNFPSETPTPQGAPATAVSAEVKVYEGTTLLGRVTVTKGEGNTGSGVIPLPSGKTLRIETSVKDSQNNEVAWGTMEQAITGSQTIIPPFKSILSEAALLDEGTVNDGRQLRLKVYGIGNSAMPLSDYDVTYQVSDGTAISQSKLGVIVASNSASPVEVKAIIKGLNKQHEIFTLERGIFINLGGTIKIRGTLPNWPLKGREASLQSTTRKGRKITGVVKADSKYEISFPDISDELDSSYTEELKKNYGDTLTISPPNVLSVLAENFGVFVGDKKVGSLGNAKPDGYFEYYTLQKFLYVDRDTEIKYTNEQGSYKTYITMSLKKGWNAILYHRSGINIRMFTTYSSPLNPSPTALNTALDFENTAMPDVAVNQVVTKTPFEGYNLSHQVQISSQILPTSNQGFTVRIPGSLSLLTPVSEIPQNDPNSSCRIASSNENATELKCIAANLTSSLSLFNFQTRAKLFSEYPSDPNDIVVTVDDMVGVDADLSNNISRETITRQRIVGGNPQLNVDLQSPTLTINTPASASAGQTVNLSGNATDNVGVERVEVYEGVKLLGKATINGATWTFPWTPRRSGSYTIDVVAFDASGNTTQQSTSATVR
ncbi:Ig-like domain-containing protein [Deinococcus sp. VB343]|uniref:Ig-like domain-containing protein n=1 Tax=Deinococcus sp. VB343 TaxID=3385567 RepID=UPI0039C9269D